MGFWQENHRSRVPFASHHIIFITSLLILIDHMADILVLFLSICTLWKEVIMSSPHLRSGDSCFPSLRVEHLHKLFGILQGRFVYSPIFIYLFNHLFISLWIQQMPFYTWVYTKILFYLFIFALIVHTLAFGSSISWLLCMTSFLTNRMKQKWCCMTSEAGHKRSCNFCQGFLNNLHVWTLTPLRL